MLEPLTEEMTQFVSTIFKESLVKFNYAYSFLTTCLNKPGQDHLNRHRFPYSFDIQKMYKTI